MIHITAAATNQTPICLIRFSAFRSPLWSFLVHTPGTIVIRSPVKSNTIRINNIFYSLYLISQNFRLQCTSEKSMIFRTDGHLPYHMKIKQKMSASSHFLLYFHVVLLIAYSYHNLCIFFSLLNDMVQFAERYRYKKSNDQ